MMFLARVCRDVVTGLIALTVLHPSTAWSQDSRAQGLQTGTVTERHRVLIQLLGRPSSVRSVAEWNALAAELRRLHDQVQTFAGLTGNDLPAIGLTSEDASLLRSYYFDLAAAVGQSKDATVVPLLLQCLDAGLSAIDALANFRDTAVDGLLATAREGRDYEHVSRALETLTMMYDARPARPLSAHSQQAIVAYLHEAWIPSPLRVPIEELADLSLATGDPQLRAIVTQLARDKSAVAAKVATTRRQPDSVLKGLNEQVRRAARPPVSDLSALRSGDIPHMEDALLHILYTPPGDRSRDIWKAVGDAFMRYHPGPEDDIAPLMIDILIQSRDPIVIPPLLKALGNTLGAAVALARFGDQSIAPLIAVARSDRPYVRGHALSALAWLLEHPSDDPVSPLSSAGRQQIVSFAQQVWRRPPLDTEAIPLTELALATGDAELRQAVTALASDPAGLRAGGVTDPEALRIDQRLIQRALDEHPAR